MHQKQALSISKHATFYVLLNVTAHCFRTACSATLPETPLWLSDFCSDLDHLQVLLLPPNHPQLDLGFHHFLLWREGGGEHQG